MSSVIPCASATARPSAITAHASSRVGGSATCPCVRPVSAAIAFEAALKISFRHWAPRASARAWVGMPARVQASASASTASIGAGLGSNGPMCVSPRVSQPTWPGSITWPAGNVVPRITSRTCSAISSSLPAPFWTEATAPKACAVAAIASEVCMLFTATIPSSQGGSAAGSAVALTFPTTSPAPESRSPFALIASTCSCQGS